MNQNKVQFELLFETYYTPFCFFALKFISSWDVCEDIVSEVFAKLWIERETISLREESAIAYIKLCVKNQCLNKIKHNKVKYKYQEEVKFLHSANSDENLVLLEDLYEELNIKLQELSEEHRSALIAQFFKNKSQDEVAKELNVSTRTIGRYKKETLDFLRRELAKHFFILSILQSYSYIKNIV